MHLATFLRGKWYTNASTWRQDPILKQRASLKHKGLSTSDSMRDDAVATDRERASTRESDSDSDADAHIPRVAENPWIKSERRLAVGRDGGARGRECARRPAEYALALVLAEGQSELPEAEQDFEMYRPGFVSVLTRRFTSMGDLLDTREESALYGHTALKRSSSVEQLLASAGRQRHGSATTSESSGCSSSEAMPPGGAAPSGDAAFAGAIDGSSSGNESAEREVGHDECDKIGRNHGAGTVDELPRPNTVQCYRSLFETGRVDKALVKRWHRVGQQRPPGSHHADCTLLTNGHSEPTDDMVVTKITPAIGSVTRLEKNGTAAVKAENQKNITGDKNLDKVSRFEKRLNELHNQHAPIPRQLRARASAADAKLQVADKPPCFLPKRPQILPKAAILSHHTSSNEAADRVLSNSSLPSAALSTHHIVSSPEPADLVVDSSVHDLPAYTPLSTHNILSPAVNAAAPSRCRADSASRVLEEELVKPSSYRPRRDAASTPAGAPASDGDASIAATDSSNSDSSERQVAAGDVCTTKEESETSQDVDGRKEVQALPVDSMMHSQPIAAARQLDGINAELCKDGFVIKPNSALLGGREMGCSSGSMKLPPSHPQHRGIDSGVLARIRSKGKVYRYDTGVYTPLKRDSRRGVANTATATESLEPASNKKPTTTTTTTPTTTNRTENDNERVAPDLHTPVNNEVKLAREKLAAVAAKPLVNGHSRPLRFRFELDDITATPKTFGQVDSTTEVNLPSPIECDPTSPASRLTEEDRQEEEEEEAETPSAFADDDTPDYGDDYDADDDDDNDAGGYSVEDLYGDMDASGGAHVQRSAFGNLIFSSLQEEDEEEASFLVHVEPCNISFDGEMVLMEGRSCFIKERNKNLRIKFRDNLHDHFEYPSEQSLLEDTEGHEDSNNSDAPRMYEFGTDEESADVEPHIQQSSALKTTPSIGSTNLAAYYPTKTHESYNLGMEMSRETMDIKVESQEQMAILDDTQLIPGTDETTWSESATSDLLF
ncbi:PREDICTED: uncharacterized protein LOC106812735 isoform X2 [Priapulus caudatus]|uniref:Uncharacterized protein LOC106812735 isoform X2 n=1 Tax=Priapulus caudatus TaxID=37621 RepID=A0ABM1EJ02_PRICU|nr:PREDICTED: uncharacterized protein LOC106812735 isoform X2 [Priapulus caudatus]